MPPVNIIVVQILLLPPERQNQEVLAQAQRLLGKALAPLNAALQGRNYLIGDFSAADIMLGHACYMSRRVGASDEDLPHLDTYLDRIEARPAFQKGFAA